MGKQWKQWQTIFLDSKITVDGDCSHEIKRCFLLGRKDMTNTLLTTKLYRQSYGFSSSHVWMWELDHKESWTPRNWCFLTVVLEKILESFLDCEEIKPVNLKGNQPWIFIERIDAETDILILCLPHMKSRLIGKGPDAGKDWGQEEKGTTEDEMAGWHHWLNGHEFEWTPGVGDGQGNLACWDSWGRKESDTTEWVNRTEVNIYKHFKFIRIYILLFLLTDMLF